MKLINFFVTQAPLLLAISGRADPLDTWTWRNPLPTANALSGIAYANNQFVVVGEAGTILMSDDGLGWTQRRSGTEVPLFGVAYGDGRFVAVGGNYQHLGGLSTDSIIVTSTNAADWEMIELPGLGQLRGVAYGNGQFVAVGGDGMVATSLDGLNWGVDWPGLQFSGFNAVTFANGQFVAVGGNPGLVLVSSNGVNWGQSWSGTNELNAVTYGNGEFVAVGSGDILTSNIVVATYGAIVTSTNGTDWMEHLTGNQGEQFLYGVAYGNGLFVAVGGGDNAILTSTNGESWTPRSAAPSFLGSVAYAAGRFVGLGPWGEIFTSSDGNTWSPRQQGPIDELRDVTYGAGRFVAVGSSKDEVFPAILTSSDAIHWKDLPWSGPSSERGLLNGVAYGNGKFVAVGPGLTWVTSSNYAETNVVLTSADGLTWVRQDISAPYESLWGVTYGGGQFVSVSAHGGILTSTNARNWVQRTVIDQELNGVAYGNGRFVAVGDHWTNREYAPILVTSEDGLTWVQRDPGISASGTSLSSVAYGNGQFVVVGAQIIGDDLLIGTPILTSNDGVNWIERQSGSEGDSLLPTTTNSGLAYRVVYGNGQFVVVGFSGGLLTSRDGVNWVRRQSGAGSGLAAVGFGNGYFMAVGARGTILQSDPIITLGITPTAGAGLMNLSLTGPTGLGYTIQSSPDLISWRDLTNLTSTQPITVVSYPEPGFGQGFYRALAH
jgi:hypothetical protein